MSQKVIVRMRIDNFKGYWSVVVHNVRNGLNSKQTNNPDWCWSEGLKVYVQDLDTEERYVICDYDVVKL